MYMRQNEVKINSVEHLQEVWKTGKWHLNKIENDNVIVIDQRPDTRLPKNVYWFKCPLDMFLQLPQTGIVTGLIFHMSRCGSTLCRNLLDIPDEQICLNEPDLVNDAILNNDPDIQLFFSRMSGKVIIKTSSWNVMKIEWLKHQFPQAKTIFIYRDPLEVLASVYKKPNGWDHTSRILNIFDVNECDRIIRFALCLEQMMLKISETEMIIPYTQIIHECIYGNLPKFLNYSVNESEMILTSEFDSKRPDVTFVNDTITKKELVQELKTIIPEKITNKLTEIYKEISNDFSHSH